MPNTYDLSGRMAVVTGGAGGLGLAIARLLAHSGAAVWVWDLAVADSEHVRSVRVDITNQSQVAKAIAEIATQGFHVDLLINCAGYLGMAQPFETHGAADWRRIVDLNLVATMEVTQAFIPHFRRQRSGRIINMGSLAGKEGLSGLAAYSAASAGVIAFTKALSRELIADGIFVNCVAPGPIDTQMIASLGPEVVQRMIGDSPMRRLGSPDEVAHLVAWLCSDASKFNTGAVFDMSGGRAQY